MLGEKPERVGRAEEQKGEGFSWLSVRKGVSPGCQKGPQEKALFEQIPEGHRRESRLQPWTLPVP